jgi:hypothetical protein
MPKVLVAGMSGTGKSAALRELGGREDAIAALLARIAALTGNPYGKHPAERAQILRDLAEVEPLLRATATIEIDATAPVPQVVRHLESLALKWHAGRARGQVPRGPEGTARLRSD